jgi:hypothetical protein
MKQAAWPLTSGVVGTAAVVLLQPKPWHDGLMAAYDLAVMLLLFAFAAQAVRGVVRHSLNQASIVRAAVLLLIGVVLLLGAAGLTDISGHLTCALAVGIYLACSRDEPWPLRVAGGAAPLIVLAIRIRWDGWPPGLNAWSGLLVGGVVGGSAATYVGIARGAENWRRAAASSVAAIGDAPVHTETGIRPGRTWLVFLGAVALVTLLACATGWMLGGRSATLRVPPRHSASIGAPLAPGGSASPRSAESGPLPPPAVGEASVLFVGDVLPLGDRSYFAMVAPLISSADLAVCNLECPLSRHGTRSALKLDATGAVLRNEYLFQTSPSQAEQLAEAGFDVATLANNHIMDYGGEALLETLMVLDRAGLRHCGAGADERETRRPVIVTLKGQTLAFLAYVSAQTLPATDGFAATPTTAGTVFVFGDGTGRPSQTTRELVRNDISAARQKSDVTVVSFHWGTEGRDHPNPLQCNLAHYAIDCGADIVVGHHVHKLQGVEVYKGRPIIYSLGNFAFPTTWESNHFSAAAEVRFREGVWQCLAFHPVRLRYRIGVPAPAQTADLRRIEQRITQLSAQLGTEVTYAGSGTPERIVLTNPDANSTRRRLLKSEERYFTIEAHPDLSGMSTVGFLAWDLLEGHLAPRPRSVVVSSGLAQETRCVFKEIYLAGERFPIHEVLGYDYRTVTGGSGLSYHALGRAIDINRAENPMIQAGEKLVHPDEPPYTPKEWQPGEDPYSIPADGSVVRIFKSHGWRWGGDWNDCRDYQHFDKPPG